MTSSSVPLPSLRAAAQAITAGLRDNDRAEPWGPVAVDIESGDVRSASLGPERDTIHFAFRVSDATRMRAELTASIPSVVLVLHRRASCVAEWSPVFWSRRGMDLALPGAGEYLLSIRTTASEDSTEVRLDFSISRARRLLRPSEQDPKLARSWLRGGTLRRLRKAGVRSFGSLTQSPVRNAARKAGIWDREISEIVRVAPWLDVPWIDYSRAAAIVRNGLAAPADYYRLTSREQRKLDSLIAYRAVPSQQTGEACIALDSSTPQGTGGPAVDWTWLGQGYGIRHTIHSRPWWGSPVQPATAADGVLYDQQLHWYPDPASGWEVLGFNFTGYAPVGYMLVYNRYCGVLRLFLYLPNTNFARFSQLLARISIVSPSADANSGQLTTWSFPLMDIPPTNLGFDPGTGTAAIGGGEVANAPQEGLSSAAGSPGFVWQGSGTAFDNLFPTGTAEGSWLRTEIPMLYDPNLYPETQPLRDLPGCLHAVFPFWFAPQTAGLGAADLRSLRLTILGLQVGDANLYADLAMELTGDAVPSSDAIAGTGRSTVGLLKDAFTTGLSAGAAASTVVGYLGTFGGPAGLVVAAGLAGVFFGVFGGGDPTVAPRYRVALAGSARGPITGKVYTALPVTIFDLFLEGTFGPFDGDPGSGPPIGPPESFQRCREIRLGVIGFRPPSDRRGGIDMDPRPKHVGVFWLPQDPSNPYSPSFVPMISVGPVGAMQVAPWAPVDITSQSAQLELLTYQPMLPHRRQVLLQVDPGSGGDFTVIGRNDLDDARDLGDGRRLYLRWFATITPRDPTVPPFEIQYALNVGDRLRIDPEPSPDDPPDQD